MTGKKLSVAAVSWIILSSIVWIRFGPSEDLASAVEPLVEMPESNADRLATVAGSETTISRGQQYLRLPPDTSYRQGPGPGSAIVARSASKQIVPVLESRGPWARVRTTPVEGVGSLFWVAKDDGQELLILGGGREAHRADPAVVDLARGLMADHSRKSSCGPYELIDDLDESWPEDVCSRLVPILESIFLARFGVEPLGEARESIFFFANPGAFRSFVTQSGGGRIGYAAHAVPAAGYLALYEAEEDRQRSVRTLMHELTHLVSYRAFGPDLPRWLSEGIADAIGDTATLNGFRDLEGFEGCKGEAKRLVQAYRDGRAGGLDRLLGLEDREFDVGVVNFDYEQSALLVRYLLTEESLSEGMKSFLEELSLGRIYDPEVLSNRLGTGFDELDDGFEAWLETEMGKLD